MGIEEQIDRLIDLGEDIKSRLDLLVKLASDHFAGADKMVANEPPKKWRILEPGQVVCSGDRVTAKTNLPSDPPNGLGWRPVDASVGTSVCQDDPCVFARLVADEPAKEAEPEHRAGPKPDPGEGYRILSKNPPEDLTPGDEFENWNGKWIRSWDAEASKKQSATCWYRRKIETPKPAWEPKVGDWVKVTRPENWIEWRHPRWEGSMHKSDGMHKFDGQVGQIEREREGHFQIRGFVASKECSYIFHRDWLSPAEPPAIDKPDEPEYREPVLPADAGEQCEFSRDGKDWCKFLLAGWQVDNNPWICERYHCWPYARIKKDA